MLKRRHKTLSVASLVVVLASWLIWQLGPFQAVFAIANLSDPDKLATLGERAANPRLNKTVYWLNQAERRYMAADTAIALSQLFNGTGEPRAALVKESLLRNLKIAQGLGLFTKENRELLRHGRAGLVTQGPYTQSKVEIDHIVPYSLAPEAGNELANLEMMPQPLNREKSNRVGPRQLAHAEKLHSAGLITKQSFNKVQTQARKNQR